MRFEWHFVIGGASLVVLATLVEGAPRIAWTPRFVASLLFLGLVGTTAAFVLWFEETRRSLLGEVAAWTFLVPVFGVAFGALVLGEQPSGWIGMGIGLTLVGLAMALGMGSRVALRRRLQAGHTRGVRTFPEGPRGGSLVLVPGWGSGTRE